MPTIPNEHEGKKDTSMEGFKWMSGLEKRFQFLTWWGMKLDRQCGQIRELQIHNISTLELVDIFGIQNKHVNIQYN